MKLSHVIESCVCMCILIINCSAGFEIRDIAKQTDYIGSQPKGISIDADGGLTLADELISVWQSDIDSACWTMAADKNAIYAATAEDGKVYRYQNKTMDLLFDSPQIAILSLLPFSKNRLLAGSAPDGIIYAIDKNGMATIFFRTDAAYVWKMMAVPEDNLLIATGLPGSIKRLSASGDLLNTIEVKAAHVRTMIRDNRGGIWLGTADPARIYYLDGNDLQLVHEAKASEISAMTAGTHGIWFATVASPSITYSDSERPGVLRPGKTDAPQVSEQNSVWFIDKNRTVYEVWSTTSVPIFDLITIDNKPHLVCGGNGHIYRIDDIGRGTLLAARGDEPLTCMTTDDSGNLWLGGSSTAEVFHFGQTRNDTGHIVSTVIDAGASAVWGRFLIQGENISDTAVSFETRTGNSPEPDNDWSDWLSTETARIIQSPPGRYLQWKLKLTAIQSQIPLIQLISVSMKTTNRSPFVSGITIYPVEKGEWVEQPGRGRTFQQSMPDGLRVEYILPAGGYNGLSKGVWMQLRGMRTLAWSAGDPDNNALEYTVEMTSAHGDPSWFLIAENLTQPLVSFDSTAYADGIYRIRVLASDNLSNPLEESLTAECRSVVFEIDNTPPALKDLKVTQKDIKSGAASKIRLTGTAIDSGRRISLLEYSLDARTWHRFNSIDGMLDEPKEMFDIEIVINRSEPFPKQVVIRATDDHENVTTATIVVDN